MSKPKRTFAYLVALAIAAVVLMLTGKKMYEDWQQLHPPASAPAPSSATGEVRFADGSPAAAARVHCTLTKDGAEQPAEIPVGPDGRFAVPDGATDLRAEFGPFAADPGSDDDGTSFDLPGSAVIAGLIQTGDERRPVEGATVTLGAHSVTTDSAGAFRFEAVTAADCTPLPVRVVVKADGYALLDHAIPAKTRAAAYGDLALRLIPLAK